MVAIIHASRRLYRAKKLHNGSLEVPLPGVSILKPITGVDPNLYNNLETFFQMNYPLDKHELLFCVQEKNDPAIPLIENLRMKNPQVLTSLFVGGEAVGINPKINNLMPGYKSARFDHIMISDAGLKMLPETLLDMVSYLNDKTVLVHQLPFVCLRQGFAGILEMIYFGCQQARMYLVADLFGFVCLTGMSFIVKKEILDDVGGLQTFGKYIGEDYFIAQTVLRKNLRFAVCSLPALQNSGICSVRAYQDRMIRWTRLRVHMLPQLLVFEPVQECVFSGMLASWAASMLFEWNFLVFFLIYLLVWFLLDYALIKLIQGSHLHASCSSPSSSAVDAISSSSSSSPLPLAASTSPSLSPNNKSQHLTNFFGHSASKGKGPCCCGGDGCGVTSASSPSATSIGCFADESGGGVSGLSGAAIVGEAGDSPDDFLLFREDSMMPTTTAAASMTASTTKLRPSHSRSSSLTLSSSASAAAAGLSSSTPNAASATGSTHAMQLSSRLHLNSLHHSQHHHYNSNNYHHHQQQKQRHLLQQPLKQQQQQQQNWRTLTPEHPFPVSKFDFLIGWIFREFSVLYLFMKAISTNKVTWRTGAYRLEWGGTATAAETPLKQVEIA